MHRPVIKTPTYEGPDRRIRARRRLRDRRRNIRWEPRNADRRQLEGRRRGDIFYYTGANR